MSTAKLHRRIAVLATLLLATASFAQEPAASDVAPAPNVDALSGDWWSYFEGAHDEVEEHAKAFLELLNSRTIGLQPQNQEIAQAVLDAVTDNLSAYVALLTDVSLAARELPALADAYSLDELLELAAQARTAIADAENQQLEVEREQRVLDGATRRRDLAFKDYVDAEAGDAHWIAGLRLIQARSAQAISMRRLELLKRSYEREQAYADALAERVEVAQERLTVTADHETLDALVKNVEDHEAAVADAEERYRAASVAAIGLDLSTVKGRYQQRLEQQRQIAAEVGLARARVALGKSQARRRWTEMQLDQVPDLDVIEEQIEGWSALIREIEQHRSAWKADTESELLAVQSVGRDGLDRAIRRLLNQRLGTGQETLSQIGELEADVADLQLLARVTESTAAKYGGTLRSWRTYLGRQAKAFFQRAASLADVTLFSIGETPITGADILRVAIIMIIAFLLSRGIRATIRRIGESDNAGTQASFYTVARLTHYSIVILAVIIALSSIGLDFSNLALVAGALGVGLGFGLQSIVSNFVSGLIILFEHTLRVGDYIELDTGLTGTVKAINVRSTLINTNDNIDIVVPNSEFVTTRLTNWTLGERTRRVRIPFGVAYGTDKELVRKAALEAADEVQYTLKHTRGREPEVWLVEFGESSLDFIMLIWVNRQGARRPTRTRAAYLWKLEEKLSSYGITIPFPQRDLHLRSGFTEKLPDEPCPD